MKAKRVILDDQEVLTNVEIELRGFQLMDYIKVKDEDRTVYVHKDKIICFEAANENT